MVGRASRSSANVRSGCAVISAASRCSCPANTRDRNFVCGRGARDPVSRRRWIKRCTHARLTPNVAAISSASPLASHARATRFRRSIEYGAIATSIRREEYHGHRYVTSQKRSSPETVRVIVAEAEVRVTADPNSVSLLRVPGGTILDVKAKESAWYSVWLPGTAQGLRRLGYVAASDVERFSASTVAAPAAFEGTPKPSSPTISAVPVRSLKNELDEAQIYTERLPQSTRVVIQLFSATDADITKGEKKDETKTLQADGPRLLADRFVSKRKELGPFADVVSAPSAAMRPDDALIVEGKFVELDPGSRAKRYFVGMGAGKSAVAVEGSIKSADGTLLATFRQRRVGVMGMGGGDSIGKLTSDAKNIGDDLAKFLSGWAKGTLK